ncbi:MAG: putative oxidoreductase [Acidimicrobiaceae bacterium]|nr:putative oxidoreductase [Acidimicrobiaceae bacterium]
MRIGTLGAARITRRALLEPAAEIDGVEVAAVAARDADRARAFADEHGIETVHTSYAALLADDSIDAIYNPLPASAHAEWSIRALEAGKHVLCEKPFAMNAAEAEVMVAAAERTGLVLMEAFHWRYHPIAERMIELAAELGPLIRGESVFLSLNEDEDDIRFQLALGGGATMDLGCYCIHWLRTVTGEEPEVVSASAVERPAGVDLSLDADLVFPGGLEARVRSSFAGPGETVWYLTLEGRDGRMRVENPLGPQFGNRITAELADGRSIDEEVTRRPTYLYQLEAFRDVTQNNLPYPTGGADAIANMRVIDAVYEAAGLPLR